MCYVVKELSYDMFGNYTSDIVLVIDDFEKAKNEAMKYDEATIREWINGKLIKIYYFKDGKLQQTMKL